MSFFDLQTYDEKLLADYCKPLGAGELFSSNTKCGRSIDFPIARTCRPTPICAELCYGSKRSSPQGRDISVLERQLRVLHFFRRTDPIEAAHRVVKEAGNVSCIRWCGVGDLEVEVVRAINVIANQYPLRLQWVVTRKPEMAARIVRGTDSVFVMFSLDGSHDSRKRLAEMARHQHPRVYYSFLRRYPDEDTLGAVVVFDAVPGMPAPAQGFQCPADAGRFRNGKGKRTKKHACERCGWRCASPAVMDRR